MPFVVGINREKFSRRQNKTATYAIIYHPHDKTCRMTGPGTGVMLLLGMQPVDKFMLAVGVLWSLFTLYGICLLLPFMERRLREWEIKRKPIRGTLAAPTRPQRIVFLLLTLLMTAVAMADAFHRNLRATIGISSGMAVSLMIILPALYFALGLLKRKSGQGPET